MINKKYTISAFLINDNGELKNVDEPIVIDPTTKTTKLRFKILCDNKEDNNSFYIGYNMDEMIVDKNRCILNVQIKPNNEQYDKKYVIYCTHSDDNNVYVVLEIILKSQIFKISFTDNTVEKTVLLKSLFTKNNITENTKKEGLNQFYEEIPIRLKVNGGKNKYRIYSIERLKNETVTFTENNVLTKFDIKKHIAFENDFVIKEFDDYFVIKNYGRTFLEDDSYFLIRICHDENQYNFITLKVTYDSIKNYITKPKETIIIDKDKKKTDIKPKPLLLKTMSSKDNFTFESMDLIQSEKEKMDVDIIIDDTKEYIIKEDGEIEIPFKVMENGKESDLLVWNLCRIRWCDVWFSEDNRVLKIKINEKPITNRKCLVTIQVYDFPNSTKHLIINNITE